MSKLLEADILSKLTPNEYSQSQKGYAIHKETQEYLHISGDFVVKSSTFAWYGTQYQLNNLLENPEDFTIIERPSQRTQYNNLQW